MSEADFICPALQHRLEGLEASPAPAELSWDICSNGGVSILFAFVLFVGFSFAVRIFCNGQAPGYVLTHPFEPFEPPSLRFFVACIGGMSFILTAPMFYTRLTEGRWIGKFVMQQLLPDYFSRLVGCEPLNGGNTTYLLYPVAGDPDSGNQVEEFDYNFYSDIAIMPHAVFGLCWDFFGTLQIFLATYSWTHAGDGSFHKKLGYFSICIFFCHMLGSSHILYRDIVHHNSFPRFSLFADVIQSTAYITRGLNAIWDKSGDAEQQRVMKTTHKIMMFIGFVHAIEGSGQIRFTAWWIWMISRFVPMSIVWKIIFFRIETYSYLTESMALMKNELLDQAKAFGVLVLGMLWIEFHADDKIPRLNAFFGNQLYSVLFFGIPVLMQLRANNQIIRICIVLALLWNTSPYTPAFLPQELIFFIISCSLFRYTTNVYCNDLIRAIEADSAKERKQQGVILSSPESSLLVPRTTDQQLLTIGSIEC